jgi:hypothetical protein
MLFHDIAAGTDIPKNDQYDQKQSLHIDGRMFRASVESTSVGRVVPQLEVSVLLIGIA